MDPEQILLDGNDFEDGSDYGDYEFIQDQDALSLNAPLDTILDPSAAPVSCQSSPNEDSLAISQNLDEQTVGDTGSSNSNSNGSNHRDTIRTITQQGQPNRPQHQKLTIKTIILSGSGPSASIAGVTTSGSGTSLVTLNSGTASSSSSNASSPASSSPSSVSSPAPAIGGSAAPVRFGLGGGKPSAAALRRGPGRPKKDFIPLLKMSSSGGGANSTGPAGTGVSGYVGTSTMIKLSGATIAAAASLGGGNTSPSSESKIVKRYKSTNVVRGGIPKRKVELAAIAMHDSTVATTITSSTTAGVRSPSGGTSLPLSSPTAGTPTSGGGGFGSLLSSPNEDGPTGGASTANSSVASTPTGELEADPAQLMPAPDDMPYFPEKYPGKLCILCNLGERSQLGQGEMLRIEMTLAADQIASALSQEEKPQTTGSSSTGSGDSFGDKSPRASSLLGPPHFGSSKRQKGSNKCKNPIPNAEYTDELEKIGHLEVLDSSINDGGYFYIHRSCALWSYGVGRDPMSCPKWYHFPCVAASGGFQVIQTYSIFCKEHLGQVPLVCTEDINCRQCSALGDVGNLIMCSICGDHYHGTCVGLAQLPGVRTGWQCNSCKKCQICRVPDSSEGRSVACELCDKIYHASCLRPIMTTIPKLGWKCRCCRVCSDCGARTPGAGASSRWHSHYTVCDSCYQQRNKGFSCPICHRAYRAAAHREMVKCSVCFKFVHSTCDSDAELSVYNARKEANPDYEYLCSPCKTVIHSGRLAAALRRSSNVDEDSMSLSQESLNDEAMDVDGPDGRESAVRDRLERSGGSLDVGLGKGKPYVASKIAKKRLGLSLAGGLAGNRPKGLGKGFQKKSRLADITRKRGSKAKMRGIFGVPGLGLQRPTADLALTAKANEEEPGGENRLVLCSAKDKFVLTQDICVMCGAIGTDQEGCLISCTQCGQCYHPYCTNVKVTKVILQKGWRCLDCTICEGCGQRHDEARLILCDDCDISYHIYCMDPPLEQVPQGTWKCKWCAMCLKCGANSPGYNCTWMNSYTECGPCASQQNCPSCNEGYAEGELIIQCHQCERWLHCFCDQIKNETDAERCAEDGYTCMACRPAEQPPPHLVPKRKTSTIAPMVVANATTVSKTNAKPEEKIVPLALEGNHYLDGVCLSEHGLHQIKALQAEFGKRGKRKPKLPLEPPPTEKDAGILAAIESVVAGSSHDNSLEEMRLEPLDPKEEAEIYKDGMVWNDPTPPEGFALFTTENGTVVLRKKRQRNLQKLGIGGFFVRNRGIRTKDGKEDEDLVDGLAEDGTDGAGGAGGTKPKKKPIRRKPKSKLIEIYPSILQDAFFGRTLLNSNMPMFEAPASDDDGVRSDVSDDKTLKLTAEELKLFEAVKSKQEEVGSQSKDHSEHPAITAAAIAGQIGQTVKSPANVAALSQNVGQQRPTTTTAAVSQQHPGTNVPPSSAVLMSSTGSNPAVSNFNSKDTPNGVHVGTNSTTTKMEEDENSDTEALNDVLGLPNVIEEDFVSQIIPRTSWMKHSGAFDELATDPELTDTLATSKDELVDMLSPHFDLTNIGQMDSKVVEEIFKTVLTDESQESQESMLASSMTPTSNTSTPSHSADVTKKAVNTRYIATGGQTMVQTPQPQHSMQDPLQSQQPPLPFRISKHSNDHYSSDSVIAIDTTSQPAERASDKQQQQQQQPSIGAIMGSVQATSQTTQQISNPYGCDASVTHIETGIGQQGPMGGQIMLQQQQQQQQSQHQPGSGGIMSTGIMQPSAMGPNVTQQQQPQAMSNTFSMMPQQQPQQQMSLPVGTVVDANTPNQQQLSRGTMLGGYQDPVQNQPSGTITAQPQIQPTGQWTNQNLQSVPSSTPMDTTPVSVPVLPGVPTGTGAVGEMIGTLDDTNVKSAQKLSDKMRKDEMLGDMSTISSVLYCNMRHPELKTEFPNWNDRWKQISKRWRLLSNEEKQPFLQQARDNRSASKMKKTQQ
uniref:Histone-lysine N-methyltransferase n=1 Tax=Anopheles funestus TaxID=62324 RepID=A0A4Y0BEZ4_ANOFN